MKFEQRFLTLNPCFRSTGKIKPKGIMLHSVGCAQPNPDVFAKRWNASTAQVLTHGMIGPNHALQFLQWDRRAWHCGVAYKGGPSANDTHIGIEMTEPATIKYTGGATFIDNAPELSRLHVRATYENAVDLFAQLCTEFGFDPLTAIISHAEGYKLKVASNHGDPTHLWRKYPELGYTMDTFRKDVKKAMEHDSPSKWAETATAWAVENGIFCGDEKGRFNWQEPITREQVAQVLYRLHSQDK